MPDAAVVTLPHLVNTHCRGAAKRRERGAGLGSSGRMGEGDSPTPIYGRSKAGRPFLGDSVPNPRRGEEHPQPARPPPRSPWRPRGSPMPGEQPGVVAGFRAPP